MKKIIAIITGIIIIIVTGLICIRFWNNDVKNGGTISTDENIIHTELDMEQAEATLNTGDKETTKATVNGEEISQLDLNYQKLINENSKTEKSNDNILEQCIRNEVILQECEKNDMGIDEEEKQIVREYYSGSYTDEDDKIAKALGMTKEEYCKTAIQKIIDNRNVAEFHNKIFMKILRDEIAIDSQSYNAKVEQAKNASEANEKIDIYEEAYNEYINYLMERSEIIIK